MRGVRAAGVFLAVFVLPLSVCACGGGGGETGEVEQAVEEYLTDEGSDLHVGLNASGAIVAVNQSLVGYFSGGEKTIDNVEVSDVKVKEDQATAKAGFRLSSSSGTVNCESAVLVMRRDGEWKPGLFTVGSCT